VDEILCSLKRFYPDITMDIIKIDTYGDRNKHTPISEIEGGDFFTKEIDEALLNRKIDFAIHSAKDLPEVIPDGLCVAGITESIDPYDVLVSKSGLKLDELPHKARIGTSSQCRKEALKKLRPDFEIVDIRGNIEERLSKLDNDKNLDAIVIAAAGLIRLGLEQRISQKIPFEILKPHPLQGRLAVMARKNDEEIQSLFYRSRARGSRADNGSGAKRVERSRCYNP